MKPSESIYGTLLRAAAALRHSPQGGRYFDLRRQFVAAASRVRRKLAADPDAVLALDLALAKPESLLRLRWFMESTVAMHLATDRDVVRLNRRLAAVLRRLRPRV